MPVVCWCIDCVSDPTIADETLLHVLIFNHNIRTFSLQVHVKIISLKFRF